MPMFSERDRVYDVRLEQGQQRAELYSAAWGAPGMCGFAITVSRCGSRQPLTRAYTGNNEEGQDG